MCKMSFCFESIAYYMSSLQRVDTNFRFCAYPTTALNASRDSRSANSSQDSPLIVCILAASIVAKRKSEDRFCPYDGVIGLLFIEDS